MKKKNHTFLKAGSSLIILSIIILAVSAYFVFNGALIGPVFLAMGILVTLLIKVFKIDLKSIYPDMIFGTIDNGFLIFVVILGGTYAGVFGAIVGGAAGNTITDSIGGLFEGKIAEDLRKRKIYSKRTALSTMLGKMVGCLYGAGISLSFIWLISLVF